MKKILILGASGQLGHRLFLDLREGYTVTGVVRQYPESFEFFGVNANDLVVGADVHRFADFDRLVTEYRPEVVINCIGFVKQRTNGSDHEIMEVNGHFPQKLATLCRQKNCYMIQFSTDCVFSGKKGSYSENDRPDANDIYGRSKLVGEVHDSDHVLTLRTSIIGRELLNDTGLLEWFLRQPPGSEISGFTKAIWSGYPTHRISAIAAQLIESGDRLSGLYHLASPAISKFDLLNLLNEKLVRRLKIRPVAEPEIDRSLDGSLLAKKLGNTALEWTQLIDDVQIDFDKYEKIKSLG